MRPTLLLVVLVALPVAAVAQTATKPGLYKLAMTVKTEGMPVAVAPQVLNTEHCITQQDIDAGMQKAMANPDPKSGCTMNDYKIAGNTATWSLACKSQGMTMNGTGKGTFTASGYNFRTETKMAMMGMNMLNITDGVATRAGDCKK